MGALNITEFDGLFKNNAAALPGTRLGGETHTTSTSSSTATALNAKTQLVRLVADEKMYVSWASTAGTATSADTELAAGQPEYFSIPGSWVIAAIDDA